MVHYRRSRVPGGCYFFTVTLRDRRSALLVEHIDALRAAMGALIQRLPLRIDAMIVLPDHLHALWTLPAGDDDYSLRWQFLKARFTRIVRKRGVDQARYRRGEYRIWQSRFWEHTIIDDADFARHVDYIHFNPVKHGLVKLPTDWRWTSLHRYVREGHLPATWCGTPEQNLEVVRAAGSAMTSGRR